MSAICRDEYGWCILKELWKESPTEERTSKIVAVCALCSFPWIQAFHLGISQIFQDKHHPDLWMCWQDQIFCITVVGSLSAASGKRALCIAQRHLMMCGCWVEKVSMWKKGQNGKVISRCFIESKQLALGYFFSFKFWFFFSHLQVSVSDSVGEGEGWLTRTGRHEKEKDQKNQNST